ncbi:DbpA RNA binding domain-containing protein, partial [bacterium]|nr:DbpA RNA binding domain-containing protein [bacterium]
NDIPVEQVAAACAKLNHGNTPFLLPENQKRARKNLKSEGVNHKKSEHKRSESKRSERQKPEHRQSVHKQSEHKQFERKNFDIKKTSSKDPQFKKSQFKTRDLKNNQPQKSNIIPLAEGMERYRIEVGRCHGVSPRNIVGAIANESGLESKFIGNININQDFSLVDLPYGMPDQIFKVLEKTRVFSRQMAISKCA